MIIPAAVQILTFWSPCEHQIRADGSLQTGTEDLTRSRADSAGRAVRQGCSNRQTRQIPDGRPNSALLLGCGAFIQQHIEYHSRQCSAVLKEGHIICIHGLSQLFQDMIAFRTVVGSQRRGTEQPLCRSGILNTVTDTHRRQRDISGEERGGRVSSVLVLKTRCRRNAISILTGQEAPSVRRLHTATRRTRRSASRLHRCTACRTCIASPHAARVCGRGPQQPSAPLAVALL